MRVIGPVNANKNILKTRATGVGVVLALGIVWQASTTTGWVSTPAVPVLTDVLSSWWEMARSGQLFSDLWATLYRMFAGYGLGAAAALVLGTLMGYSKVIYNLAEPITELLRPIPSPAYIPLVILFVGLGDEMKILVTAVACFFPVLVSTYGSVRSINPVVLDTARTFHTSRRTTLIRVVFPAALPGVFTGLRVTLSIALIVAVIAEMVASQEGLGYYILNAERIFLIPEMYAGIATLAVVGYALNQVFLFVEARFLKWQLIDEK